MHDLRRQALLESGKTVSRKALSREASRSNSRAGSAQTSRHNSRQSSRAASRYPSDDEDNGNLSDDTNTWSTSSLDDLAENPESDNVDWPEELADCIQDLLDRKRSSVQGREESLATYCRLSKFHYVEEEIRSNIQDLLEAFSRSIKYETSVRESVLALKALEFLAVTAYDDTIYDAVESLLTRTIRDSTSGLVKVAAIYCLGTCTYFCGTSEDAKMDQMNLFLDIVASDGQSIEAADDAGVVTAALQQWGLLATDIEDLEGESEEVIEILMDQLGSTNSDVQIAAGENIALLYEKSYTPQEEDDEEDGNGSDEEDDEDDNDDDGNGYSLSSSSDGGRKLIKRYTAYHDTRQVEELLSSLATVSNKRISKKDKKSLHANFASILTTVENPRRGPMFSKAINQNTNRQYGSKRQVKVGSQGVMNIDRWWKWIRLATLRRVLQGGFMEHYFQGNRAVLDALPVMLREARSNKGGSPSFDRKGYKKAAKYRNLTTTRRMAFTEDGI